MDQEDIHKLIASLSLGFDESVTTHVTFEELKNGTRECEGSLIGKFITMKDINLKLMRPALLKSWRCNEFQFTRLRRNVFQFFFKDPTEVARVLKGGPWCIDNLLLVLKPWDRSVTSNDDIFSSSPFWIHVRGLPRECVTLKVGAKLAASFLDCQEIQVREFIESK